ncbi:MAG: sce7726 family protein [Ignavibacteria bacterium]|nr:sce7726 family protein [Ignavibacteria bacterium]
MNDVEIRDVLHTHLHKINKKIKDTIIVDELDLCSGLTRIDIASINGSIHGYEIKSDEDTLYRLPNQIRYYNKSLEKVTIAVNLKHLEDVENIIPEWWGILVIEKEGRRVRVKELKEAANNPCIEGHSILEILWKDELLNIAEKFQIQAKKSLSKRMIRSIITQHLNINQITSEVRQALKSRKNWRS